MWSGGDPVLSMAIHNVGREKLYLSTVHRIWVLFSHSLCGNRVLSLAATQKLIPSKRVFDTVKKRGLQDIELFFTEMN